MGNGAVVPLTGRSVFVTASEQHEVQPESANVDAGGSSIESDWINGGGDGGGVVKAKMRNSNSTSAAAPPSTPRHVRTMSSGSRTSTSTPPSNPIAFVGPRRSRAHRPTLLGLDVDEIGVSNDVEGGNQAREAIMLTGLGIHADVDAAQSPPPPPPPRRSRTASMSSRQRAAAASRNEDEEQFRIGSDTEEQTTFNHSIHDDQDDDDNDDNHFGKLQSHHGNGRANESFHSHHQNGAHAEEDERTLFGYEQDYDDDDDLDLEVGLGRGSKALILPFESTTKREKIWMWTSVAFVAALSIVSLAIAVDWIDWPGDGIGKQ